MMLTLFLFLVFGEQLNAQNKTRTESFRLDTQFGGRVIHRAMQPTGADIDFMNYLNDGNDGYYGVMNFGLTFAPDSIWTFGADMSMLSDMLPNHLRIDVMRRINIISPQWDWGLKAIIYAYPQYLNEFNRFHKETDSGIVADLNTNYRQITLFDLGISAMPYASYTNKRFQAIMGSGIGFSSFEQFNERILQKKQGGNLRREIRYETLYSPAITSHSEAEATYDFLHDRRVSLGIIAKAELLMTFRDISYKRTIFTWTDDNYVENEIHPDKKFYAKSEFSMGLYFRF
ncbi:MAG: hypothetical protein K0B15_00580 [Lentimicrobium sp.]|nr:hypothetical protein [Lentimicrobium sp.]